VRFAATKTSSRKRSLSVDGICSPKWNWSFSTPLRFTLRAAVESRSANAVIIRIIDPISYEHRLRRCSIRQTAKLSVSVRAPRLASPSKIGQISAVSSGPAKRCSDAIFADYLSSDFRSEDEVNLCFEPQVYLALSPSCSATVCRSR
jgi:hypothetical protein